MIVWRIVASQNFSQTFIDRLPRSDGSVRISLQLCDIGSLNDQDDIHLIFTIYRSESEKNINNDFSFDCVPDYDIIREMCIYILSIVMIE